MRNIVLFFLSLSLCWPAFAAKRVSVGELEKSVADLHTHSDKKIAGRILSLQLTERLTGPHFARLSATLPGPDSRRALTMVADAAALLDPPAAERPALPVPDMPTLRSIVSLFAKATILDLSNLPNFFASRETTYFENTYAAQLGPYISGSPHPYLPLHYVAEAKDTVLYRGALEIVNPEEENATRSQRGDSRLSTRGDFGAIMGAVLIDVAKGKLTWSNWEEGEKGSLAVFKFEVPAGQSHYGVNYCCFERAAFHATPAYHGELTVNPQDGSIVRLKVVADMKQSDPVTEADMIVEYGPVTLGGVVYVCPLKSVSILKYPAPEAVGAFKRNLLTGQMLKDPEYQQVLMNDVVFLNHHLYRAEARIITDSN